MTYIEEIVNKQETRENVKTEKLTNEVLEDFEIGLLSFRRLQPRIEEVRRRFLLLSKDSRIDGTVETIDGCKSFKEWCLRKIGKPANVVEFLLRGGSKKKESKEKKEINTISTLKFTKTEIGKLKIFFETYLGVDAPKKDQEELLRKTFNEYLDALIKE